MGHSHGGNVAVQAANLLVEHYQGAIDAGEISEMPEISIVTLNTPVRKDYQLTENAQKNVTHYNIYNNTDVVQKAGGIDSDGSGSLAGRKFDNAINIRYSDQIPLLDKSGCGGSSHCGTSTENANHWIPKLNKAIEEKN